MTCQTQNLLIDKCLALAHRRQTTVSHRLLVCWAVPRRADDDADQHDVTAEPAKVVDFSDPQTYQDLATPMPETRQEDANLY
ncbi:unnamed protein product [Vitrella brassicaformis CCMP3155]|uniref:Uncharacterized protein n=1 Tax=Vitrella brassicaformis (strain CCMP3155) TaxID=1169540 RepID=A0A0G4FWG4_VITBC|nr:unnamed protein product [Vitrella brassicaformis CCMP3155]|eukprot:CEM19557.1 unnamed protein product [Vitrella brassicaformis CCMP3155]